MSDARSVEFGNFDVVSGDRLSEKPSPPLVDDEDLELPARALSRTWDTKPSVHQQLTKVPETTRLGATVTAVLNLSLAEELDKLNLLQAQADDWQGPFIHISELNKQFHNGAWFVLIRYAQIFYQKL